jgi:Fe-S-cluster containining protein
MKKEAGSCLFLDGNSMCRIYDSRPIICRCYPFSVEFESSNTVLFASSKECPSIGNGVMMRKKFFEKLAAEVKNNLKSC